MKTKIISIVVMLLMACNVMAQDYMRVYFKDGSERKFYLKDITSIATKKLDADGIQHSDYEYQHITTHHNKYVYNLNEVDSITFCKFNEEEVINNLSNALPDLFDIYSECGNIHDAENFIQHINNLKGVEKAWSDGHQLFVSFTGWETMSFEFNHDEEAESNSKEHIVEQAKSAILRMEYAVSPKAGQLRAVIANQQHYDESRRHYIDDYYLPLKKKLEDCNIHTTYEDKPDLAFFSDRIFTYDIVFLVTHGGYSGSTHVLRTGEEYGRFTKKKKYEFWKDEDDVVKRAMAQEIFDALSLSRSSYPESTNEHFYSSWRSETENGESCFVNNAVFTELFIEEYANGEFQNPYSIIFNTACQSLMGDVDSFYDIPYSDSLAQLFFNRNLGFYFGYNQTNTIGKKAGPYFYDLLLNGLSLTSAYSNLPSDYVHEFVEGNDVYLIPLQNPSLTNGSPMFLIQTYTEQKDQEVAMDNFYSMKGVEVVGYTTTNKSDAITYGFAYGTDRNLSEATMITVTDTISLIKAIEQGNLRFRGTLTDLQPGNTYYYCAYTCDGSDYNCGDTLSFLIPIDLRLSTQELTLAPGSTTTVEITSGNGDYTVSVDKPSIAKASVSGTTVTIEGVANGTAKVTIKDKASQTADIKVTISSSGDCPVAEAIDLGLPSGTLWASWNVGASKPEEYGGYYAWGETEEKENYDYKTYKCGDGSGGTYYNLGADIAGTQYDVAHVKWGGSWIMPSFNQIQELINYCSRTWMQLNGVNGILVTGLNGNTIFLPAAGYRYYSYLGEDGSECRIWSSSYFPYDENSAYRFTLGSGDSWGRGGQDRAYGLSVRPVCPSSPPSSTNITFADAAIKAICVTNWDTNKDGELSIQEAAAVKSLGTVFYEKQGISSFNELQYFTGLTIIEEEAFRECSLKSVSIPKSVKTIGEKAFMQCPNLSEVKIPEGVTWIDEEAFANCALTSIVLPESLVRLGEQALENNPLISITLPRNLAYLGNSDEDELYDGVFDFCYSMKEVNVDESNKTYASIDGVLTTKDMKFLLFYPYEKGNDYEVPEGIEQIHFKAFNECKITTVTLPSTLKSFITEEKSNVAFGSCYDLKTVHAKMKVPFECDYYSFANETYSLGTLYVPQGTKTLYETTAGWNRFQNIVEDENDCPVAEAIDLGLPSGTKWASWNVGASKPEEYGGYYAWGETEEKDYYDWSTYTHCDGSYETCHHIGDDIAGTEYDVAHIRWGGSWRMPTIDQIKELVNNCSWTWTTQNGVNGQLVTGPNGGTIFIPAAGTLGFDYLLDESENGYCWSSSLYPRSEANARFLYFNSGYWDDGSNFRCEGHSVRPVSP